MTEKLTFHFEGALADAHRMNFYESARFQYAAARLMVKLAQFRSKGKFVKKISSKSNINIQLVSQADGSFNINIEDPGQPEPGDQHIAISLSDLIAYVSERIIEKLDRDVIAGSLPTNPTSAVAGDGASDSDQMGEVDQIIEQYLGNEALFNSLPPKTKELVRRRIAESHREKRMAENETAISKIDFESGQKLVAMAAPLLSEMAQTALRRSANSFEITSSVDGRTESVLFLDQKMAQDIETAIVDREITPILADVIQFNKDNGWGKVKIEEGTKSLNFSIPYDKLRDLKQTLIDNMKKDLVYLQTYQVRDRSLEVTRLIVVGILPTPET